MQDQKENTDDVVWWFELLLHRVNGAEERRG